MSAGSHSDDYRDASCDSYELSTTQVLEFAQQFSQKLDGLPMAPAIALSALAQPVIDALDRRKTGSFYTDFRLAKYLAERLANDLPSEGAILDPACGSGILACRPGPEPRGSRGGSRGRRAQEFEESTSRSTRCAPPSWCFRL